MKSLIAQCDVCKGTGVTRERRTPKGLGLVCGHCGGTGNRIINYVPFTRRKRRDGIERVTRFSGELGAVGFGPESGPTISYEEFLSGKMPQSAFVMEMK